jgi:hypothetical protein
MGWRIDVDGTPGILFVFFCPASAGPFGVTNGPVTTFRVLGAAHALFAALNAAGAFFV